jgi:glycosyltransferase involved in cell wall biosynthesis
MRDSLTFALAGTLWSNSRALRQIGLLSEVFEYICVVGLAGHADPVELAENVDVVEVPKPEGRGPLYFRRIHRAVRDAVSATDARIYHASDLYVLRAMVESARRSGGQVVYDARELYPFVASTEGRPWSRLYWYLTERRFSRKADLVFTVSDSIADRMASLYGISRPTVLHNVPLPRRASKTDALRRRLALPADKPIVLHQGQMRPSRGCGQLVRAMRDVENAVLVFLGDGPVRPGLEREVSHSGLQDRVFFLDPVPVTELLSVTASADVGVTLLEDSCLNHRFALPNKLFQYLMAGIPVLGSDLPEIRRVILDHDVGLVVDPSDIDDVAAGINTMAADDSLRTRWRNNTGRVFETFDPARASQEFVAQIAQLLRPSAQ